jgi:hypothetical protein
MSRVEFYCCLWERDRAFSGCWEIGTSGLWEESKLGVFFQMTLVRTIAYFLKMVLQS